MTPIPQISVVIPTYQRCASVRRALAALAQQSISPCLFEVIVVIDGSEDGTAEMVEQFAAPYRLRAIRQPNRGRAAACNAGLHASEGELVIFLDDDMQPAEGFIAAHQRAHHSGERLVVIGAVPITLDAASPPVVAYIGAKFNRHLEQLAQPDYRFKLTDFYSGNSSIGRDMLIGLAGFDEAFRVYGNEDLELYLRLLRAGARLVYSPEACAEQHYTKGFRALARDNIAKGQTAVLLASKHPSALGDLKLSTYHQASLKWRLLRKFMLSVSRVWPAAPGCIMQLVEWIERRRPARLNQYYMLALDYFFWLGALAAMRANRRAGQLLAARARAREGGQP
jgi:glycosyltransferase involved in cell wall biosynthesis